MKWYVEFPIIWVIVVIVFFFVTPYRYEDTGLGIVMSLTLGSILAVAVYAGYHKGKRDIMLKQASDEERNRLKKKARKRNRLLIWIIIAWAIILIGIIVLMSMI